MSPRERNLLAVLIVVLGGGGAAILGYQWFVRPLGDYNKQIAKLVQDVNQKEEDLGTIRKEKKLLERAKAMSLPAKPDVAVAEYSKFLQPLLRESGLEVDNFQAPSVADVKPATSQPGQGKKPTHQVLTFQVRAKGDLAAVVRVLEAIQEKPLMHRVKSLALDRIDTSLKATSHKLNVQMTVEAMIVGRNESRAENLAGIDPRLMGVNAFTGLIGGPAGVPLLGWVLGPSGPVEAQKLAQEAGYRKYADVARKNIFVGGAPPPVAKKEIPDPDAGIEVMEFVRLETTNTGAREAFLRNRVFQTPTTRLRAVPGSGYDTFKITNELRTKTLLRGKVLRVDQRDVYFQVKDEVYALHIGQTLAEALRRPLGPGEMEELSLTSLYDEAFAAQDDGVEGKGKSTKTRSKGR